MRMWKSLAGKINRQIRIGYLKGMWVKGDVLSEARIWLICMLLGMVCSEGWEGGRLPSRLNHKGVRE